MWHGRSDLNGACANCGKPFLEHPISPDGKRPACPDVDRVKRATYLPVPHVFKLNQACLSLAAAFDHGIYLVGSCLERRDYRDVDVRAILSDAEYDRLFPGMGSVEQFHPLWSVMCASISVYLEQLTGLPIDFQIQKQSEANEKYPGPRSALGMFIWKERELVPV